jgi:MarR family transcriptional regulator, organic hydroperoxide resistance regulator
VRNLHRAAGALRAHFERTALAGADLTWTGWVVLRVVWQGDAEEAGAVAAEAGISKGTLTGVATTLENRGLLVRRGHPQDGRRVVLALTPRGRRLARTLSARVGAEERAVLAGLSAREAKALTSALAKLVTGLGAGAER